MRQLVHSPFCDNNHSQMKRKDSMEGSLDRTLHCVESVHIRSYSGPHFPAFGLNTSPNVRKCGPE